MEDIEDMEYMVDIKFFLIVRYREYRRYGIYREYRGYGGYGGYGGYIEITILYKKIVHRVI